MKDYKNPIYATMKMARANLSRIADNIYQQGYEAGKAATPFTDTKEAEDKAYNRGLNEAWDAARKLREIPMDDYSELFESKSPYFDFSAQEVLAKIKDYEDEQDAEIKVGDEVYSEEDDLRFVVTRITNGRYEGICTDGACYCPLPLHIKKTGRHAYRIIELLGELDETD